MQQDPNDGGPTTESREEKRVEITETAQPVAEPVETTVTETAQTVTETSPASE